uniref:Uncharacterized protein n=1 Tax=Juglanconis oblonga TaxID=1940568 RepID=A0A291LI78_9PEZI|nr:hypothetical protein [Juglanconis oblonga]
MACRCFSFNELSWTLLQGVLLSCYWYPYWWSSSPTSSSENHMIPSSQESCQCYGSRTRGSSALSLLSTCYTPLSVTGFARTRVTPFMSEDKYDALQITP